MRPVAGSPGDRMPAIGIQPVRAATKTRNSDVSSGGIDSSTSETPRMAPGSAPAAAAAGDDAERQADERGEEQRGERENRGVGRALGNQLADRPVVQQRAPEIEAHGAAQPVAVLRADRLVEAVARARLLDGFAAAPRCRAIR